MLFISHDLSVVRHLSQRIVVMNKGQIVETGATADIFSDPRHEHTQMLLNAIAQPDPVIMRRKYELYRKT